MRTECVVGRVRSRVSACSIHGLGRTVRGALGHVRVAGFSHWDLRGPKVGSDRAVAVGDGY